MRTCVFLSACAVVAVASPSSNYLDWIVKSVCVDANGLLLKVDPYFGCPTGTTSRKLQAGDPLPYNNFEQMGYQISDSSVLLDKQGQPIMYHNFDYEPFNQFNQYSGSDGYDVYSLISNTVSVSNTKDGGGYGSTFYGKGCTYGNGWALFPQNDFLSGGQDYWPIMGIYWEHTGHSSPGNCPSSYSTNTLTSWSLISNFVFSGVNGNPAKNIDALVSYHGFETEKNGITPTSNFLANGHLEVFYYTELYGLTRWEVWKPVTSAVNVGTHPVRGSAECSGTGTGVYKGINFIITDCHDWSNVKPVPGNGEIPQWPLVNANLLQYSHFEASGLSETYQVGKWGRFGQSPAGNLINWSALVSTSGGDANDGTGVAYLAFNCAAGSDNACGTPGPQAVYQDVAVDSLVCGDCAYLFGANVRTAPGGGAGTLQIAIQILSTDSVGVQRLERLNATDGVTHNITSVGGVRAGASVLWSQSFEETVQEDNGDGRGAEKDSVYLSAKFVRRTAVLPASVINSAAPGSLVLRFLLLPVTAHTFEVVDTFFNRFPVQTSQLAD
eukprot:gene15330-17541_t